MKLVVLEAWLVPGISGISITYLGACSDCEFPDPPRLGEAGRGWSPAV